MTRCNRCQSSEKQRTISYISCKFRQDIKVITSQLSKRLCRRPLIESDVTHPDLLGFTVDYELMQKTKSANNHKTAYGKRHLDTRYEQMINRHIPEIV